MDGKINIEAAAASLAGRWAGASALRYHLVSYVDHS